MPTLLNTLYVTTPQSTIVRDNEAVAIRYEGETRLRVPIHNLDGIVCFGAIAATPPLIALCAERGVSLTFLGMYGHFQARVVGPVSGNIHLRKAQYRAADQPELRAHIARSIILGKLTNSRASVMRSARETGDDDPRQGRLRQAASALARVAARAAETEDLDALRGREGEGAAIYFSVFNDMIRNDDPTFRFDGRNRRPPRDAVNALLSFTYSLLTHDAVSALESVGLDPAAGFLHADRPGRPGLALDLIEEFRPILADRSALSLINLKQVAPRGFDVNEAGGVMMNDATRKELLTRYQGRKREEIFHPFLNEKIQVGLLMHIQARLMARCLRDDLDAYPPFLWK